MGTFRNARDFFRVTNGLRDYCMERSYKNY